jgi:hypothetical protein
MPCRHAAYFRHAMMLTPCRRHTLLRFYFAFAAIIAFFFFSLILLPLFDILCHYCALAID